MRASRLSHGSAVRAWLEHMLFELVAGVHSEISRRQDLDDWLARSPLIEIVFDDEQVRTGSSPRGEQ